MRRAVITGLTLIAGAAVQPFVDRDSGAVLLLIAFATAAVLVIASDEVGSRVPKYRLRNPFVRVVDLPRRSLTRTPFGSTASLDLGRSFVGDGVTPEYLLERAKSGQTSADGQRAVAPFIDRWIRVEGTIDDISISSLKFKEFRGPTMNRLDLYFDKKWHERLAVLVPGARLRVVGQIEQINQVWLTLRHCEIEAS